VSYNFHRHERHGLLTAAHLSGVSGSHGDLASA